MSMSMTSRVVKLEDIPDDQQSTTSEDLGVLVNGTRGLSTSSELRLSGKSGLTKTSRSSREENPVSVLDDDESRSAIMADLADCIPSEARDLLHPLPEGWPRLPAVLEARNFTTTQTPAVNMASAHLELLQNIVENWLRSVTTVCSQSTRQTFTRDHGRAVGSRQHLRFDVPEEQGNLSLVGVGGVVDMDRQRSSETEEKEFEEGVPYLGAEQVVEEVMTLLAKLEYDRREAAANYKIQREKVKKLSWRIDALAERRLDTLPAAVQNEHEACARDIYELQWHISYRGRMRDRTVSRRQVAEALCLKLQQDIAFILEQSPLVKEKLEMESGIMGRIHIAKQKTTEELNKTTEKCEKLQAKSEETHEKAEQERQYMRDELVSLNKDYQTISAELDRVRAQHEKFLEKIASTEADIAQTVTDTEVMTKRNKQAYIDEKSGLTRVRDLKKTIHTHEQEQKELVAIMIKKQKKIDARKKAQGVVESKLLKNVNQLEEEYTFVHRIAQEFDLDIEDFQRKTEECEKQCADNDKRIGAIKRSLESTDEQLLAVTEDFNNVRTMNVALTTSLQTEESNTKKQEEQLKNTQLGLKKQVTDEKNARAMLESNIASDEQELEKSAEEGDSKKGKLVKLLGDLDNAVGQVLVKVEVLRTTRTEKDEVLARLQSELNDCLSEHELVERELTGRKHELTDVEQKLTADVLNLDKKLDRLDWSSEMMSKKMEDMKASSIMMTKAVFNTEKAIINLTRDLEEVTLKHDAAKKSLESLRVLLNDTSARNRKHEEEHESLMKERDGVLVQHQTDLKTNRESNTEQASKYRLLDNEGMMLKDKLLNQMEENLQIENTLKDTKQLSSLQCKMHSALCEYLKHRGLYMQTELDCMETESYTNGRKVLGIHGEIITSMDDTSKFLSDAMDHNKARKMAEEAIRRQEEAALS